MERKREMEGGKAGGWSRGRGWGGYRGLQGRGMETKWRWEGVVLRDDAPTPGEPSESGQSGCLVANSEPFLVTSLPFVFSPLKTLSLAKQSLPRRTLVHICALQPTIHC